MWLLNPYRFGGWTPANITTALWLDAADASTITTVSGAVSEWRDKSGNGRHAAQATAISRPQYASAGLGQALRFNGSNSMTLAAPQASGQNIFAVVDTTSLQTNFRILLNRSSGLSPGLYLGTAPAPYQPAIYYDTFPYTVTWNAQVRTTAIMRFYYTAGASNTGTTLVSVNAATPVSAAHSKTELSTWTAIGGGSGQDAAFDLYELIICPPDLSQVEVDRAFGYLAHKWGLTANLPSDHPYKSVAP